MMADTSLSKWSDNMPAQSPVERLIELAIANVTGDLKPEQQVEFNKLKERFELAYDLFEIHERLAQRAREERRKIGYLASVQPTLRKSSS